jgi:hypothetical protein
MELIASVPKPPGFFDPANPIGLPPERLTKDAAGEEAEKAEKTIAGAAEDSLEVEEHGDDEDKRWPLLGFANTDMAFAGDVLVVGNYHGFNIYRMTAAGEPQHWTSHGSVDSLSPHYEAASKASGLMPSRWVCRRIGL